MENLTITKTETPINPYYYISKNSYSNFNEPYNPLFFIDENLQRILAKAMLIEERKTRINLSLNSNPKKIIDSSKISFQIKEIPEVTNETSTQINISLNDENSLKFFIEEGINV